MCSVTVVGIINASGVHGLGSGDQLAHWSRLVALTVQQVAEGLCTKRRPYRCNILHAPGEQTLDRSLVVEQAQPGGQMSIPQLVTAVLSLLDAAPSYVHVIEL